MDLLSISASYPSTSLPSRSCIRTLFSKTPISSFNPKTYIPSPCFKSCITPVRCVLSTSPKPSKNSNFGSELGKPSITFKLSSPQTPATAMRGAETDAMGLLLRERIVFLGSSIDDFVADAIMSQLLLLDAQDPTKDIRLFINSPGGSLSATMAIYDAVQLVRADVSTVALGIAASTASVILGGGTKGKRFAMPNTRIMIHQPLGGASGQAIDVEIQAKEVMHNKNNITRIISGFTGRSFEQVQKDIDRDRYMSPIEAVEYGIIDGVIDRDSIIPLEPVPERVKATLNYEEMSKDPKKFLNPDIPDDEIY
ncbi:ATP-dependent Clp protease proteolytic subunit 4, chloroplastic [Gastrolobium bilobum]|uniref:ATP-dependent Clp protease proteolytic subunit 4, chloroplastic n=1 Tax=Gastrolobium bilobum TaxID=150636 RepID=UPI002AB1079B|nr:ATP-dependent Clp protease proteolytic subunit 4, chloroplastic [Gastrolobium bilobum]